MSINFPDSPTPGQVYTFGSRSWSWNGYAWSALVSTNIVTSFNGLTGSVEGVSSVNGQTGAVVITATLGGITGTANEIEVVTNGTTAQIGLPDNVTIAGNLDVLGNINIIGTLIADGFIITKSGFQGYTGNSSLEPIEGVYLDGGIF
jgi:hypothetical protein